ncbi:cation diffusion facilitator family transporter [Methanobrevibacter sp.]|uniref:cation diffusion facilitator family transporter n=1 Tax=Methanobrevibacter sp. TaxID=66852 RepID=UPI00388EA87A
MDEIRNKEGNKAAIAAVISNLILTTLNISVGYIGGSYALIAEGFHTLTDIVTTIIAYIGFKIGQKPSDEEHPMGHGRAEAVSGLIIVLFLAIVGWGIIEEAIEKLVNPSKITVPNFYVALMAILGIFLNLIVSTYIINIGKKIKSPAIVADGEHQKTDIFSSIAILVSVVVSNIGYPIFDPIVGIIIGLIILKTAYTIGRENIDNILGKVPNKKIIKKIKKAVDKTPGAYEAHNIRIDNYGSYITVNLHMKVNGKITVAEAHKIVHAAEKNILKIPEIKAVSIHACPLGVEYEHQQEIDK